MSNTNKFNSDLRKGRYAELKFMGHLNRKGISYTDVNDDEEYQKIDVDIVVHGKNGDVNVEVKSDEGIAKSGNLAIETISSRNIWSKGWIKYTQAEWLVFYVRKMDIFYKFRTTDIKIFMGINHCYEVNAGSGRCKLVSIQRLIKFIEERNRGYKYIIDVSDIVVDEEKLEIVA